MKPLPRRVTLAVLPSPATEVTSRESRTGTICSRRWAPRASPTICTGPVTAASRGTATVSSVPVGFTATGRTRRSLRLPLESMSGNSTSVVGSKPEPCSVMRWPGCAEGCEGSAGVPLGATATMPVKVRPKAALEPPGVRTRRGPVGVAGRREQAAQALRAARISRREKHAVGTGEAVAAERDGLPDGGGGDGGQGRRSRRGGGGDPGEHGGVAVDAVEAELIAAGGAVGAAAGERGIVGGVATIADIVDAGGRHDPLGDARRGSEGPGAADGIQRELDSGGVEDAHHACPVTGRQARALEGEDIAAGEAELVEVDIARGADALAHGEPAVERL